jgi:hypothetical protein
MKKLAVIIVALLALLVLVPTVASAEDVTVAQVKAVYARWTQVDAFFSGYAKEPTCTKGQGFLLVKSSLVDGTTDALNPEALIMDIRGQIVGAQYRSTAAAAPSLFGQAFAKVGSVYQLNVWFISNASGAFADSNPSLLCTLEEPTTGTTPPETGDTTLPWGLLAIAGVGILGIGMVAIRRSASRI